MRIAREKRTGNVVGGVSPDNQFANNKFLCQLADNKALIEFQENRKGKWTEEDAFVKKLYNKIIESDIYQLYIDKEDFSYEADREVIRKLYKTYVCNNDEFDSLLEEHSLYWNDDKQVVDSFVLKTIKRFTEKVLLMSLCCQCMLLMKIDSLQVNFSVPHLSVVVNCAR